MLRPDLTRDHILIPIMHKKQLDILQVNICGLSTRSIMALDQYLNERNADVVCLSETKGDPPQGQFANYKYLARSQIDSTSRQGGVAILVKHSIMVNRISSIERDDVDVVVAVVVVGGTRLMLCSVYSPPSQGRKLRQVLDILEKSNSMLQEYGCLGIVIIGDINARHSRWGDRICNTAGLAVSEFMSKHSLMPLTFINENTYVCTEGGSLIDIVVVSAGLGHLFTNQYLDHDVELFTGAPSRGHLPVWTTVALGYNDKEKPKQINDFKRTDWDRYCALLEQESSSLLDNNTLDAESLWSGVRDILLRAKRETTPLKGVSTHSKPYWTPSLSILSKAVRTARRAFKYRSTFRNREQLDQAKERFSEALNEAKNTFLTEQAHALDSDQNFWKTFRRAFYPRISKGVGDIRVDNTTVLVSNEDKARALYEEIFLGQHLDSATFDSSWKDEVEACLSSTSSDGTYIPEDDLNIPITLDEINSAVEKTKASHKSADNDGIHPMMLKRAGPLFRILLVRLFNNVLNGGKWMWPTADVIFLRKPGKDWSSLGGYRPISITSYVGKLLERVLEHRLRVRAEGAGLLPDSQHGFRAGRSTASYLFKLIGHVDHHVRSKYQVAGVFVDMQKAFDSVWHNGLLFKLKSFGINNNILRLISSFLNRQVKLHVNSHVSEALKCQVGLPQGSVLSPLLFAMFIGDMLAGSNGIALQFADDSTLLSWSKSDADLQLKCQHNCDLLSNWLLKWRMKANCGKTETVCFKGNLDPLRLSGDLICQTKQSKVLGLIVDESLSFKDQKAHANATLTTKWNMLLPFLNNGLSAQTARTILTMVILPKAFYNSHIWDTKDTLSVYSQLKSLLRAPFYPPSEMLHNLSGVPPIRIQHMTGRLGLARQLLTMNDCTLWSCERSILVANTQSLIRKVMQRRVLCQQEVARSDISRSKVGAFVDREWERQWGKFRTYHNGTGLINLMDYPAQELNLRLAPRLLSSLCAVMTGHTRLQCHLYTLGLTFTPTCVCLGGDETVWHHIFECTLHGRARGMTRPRVDDLQLQSIIAFLEASGCEA